jgi:hypothetical protein
VKTVIDIPENLYRRAKTRATETGRSLKDLLLNSLEKELALPKIEASTPTWVNRELLPEYQAALKTGAFSQGTDSSVILSAERTSRENAIL